MEFAQRLKSSAETASIPVLMLTARGHKVPPSDLGKTNIKGLMDKPFSPSDLLARVEELLAESEGERDEGRSGKTAA